MGDLSNLTIVCFGDSTTWGDDGTGAGGPAISWTSHLGGLLGGANVVNYGVKGSRLAIKADRSDSFVERLDGVEAGADVYVLFGGVNDFSRNVPLGQMDSTDPHEFYGALDLLIRGLIAKSPEARLVVMTPAKTSGKHEKDIPGSFEKNHLGLTQEPYVAAVRAVADYYSVPVIDLYAGSGISPYLPEHRERYMPDGLHYSPAGYERLAGRIAAGLRAVLA